MQNYLPVYRIIYVLPNITNCVFGGGKLHIYDGIIYQRERVRTEKKNAYYDFKFETKILESFAFKNVLYNIIVYAEKKKK